MSRVEKTTPKPTNDSIATSTMIVATTTESNLPETVGDRKPTPVWVYIMIGGLFLFCTVALIAVYLTRRARKAREAEEARLSAISGSGRSRLAPYQTARSAISKSNYTFNQSSQASGLSSDQGGSNSASKPSSHSTAPMSTAMKAIPGGSRNSVTMASSRS